MPRRKLAGRDPWEIGFVGGLALVAALRVLAFSAAFPLFNNVDECAHFDLVAKYARGHDPARGADHYDPASVRIFVLYGSPEYLRAPDPTRMPPFRRSPQAMERVVAQRASALDLPNHEIQTPPAYYVVAALWYRLGRVLGFTEAQGVYWVRFMNAFSYVLLIALAYLYAGTLHPGRAELRLGVPLLIAFFPQDVFYGISGDTFSPLMCGVSLLAGVLWIRREGPAPWLAFATGGFAALAVLTKLTNAPMLPIVLTLAAIRWRREPGADVVVAIAAALLPVGGWMLRNLWLLGDPTGTAAKVALYGWSRRAPDRILEHPLFSPAAAWGYLMHLLMIYWRGEYVWHGSALRAPLTDAFYCLSSVAMVGVGIVAGALRKGTERAATSLHAAAFLLGIGTLAATSVLFEYAELGAPSREYPFFAGGRLILGTLVPFACLYVSGIAVLMSPLAKLRTGLDGVATLAAVGLLVTTVTIVEARLHVPVFGSSYNWFALP